MNQLQLNFCENRSFGGQLQRLYDLLKVRPVTAEDAQQLGIAGSAFPRRIKDLRDEYKVPIEKKTIPYVRKFDGRKSHLSQYSIQK